MRGITKRYPGVVANDGDRPRRPARRDPRPARRERRRQDDPHEHPLRARHARTRARSCSTASRSRSPARPTRSPAASTWSTSTSCWSRSSRSPRTSCSATRRWPTRSSSTARRPAGGSASSASASASRSTPTPRSARCRWAGSSGSRSSRRSTATRRILVLDEPTAVLTPQETEEIFEVLRRLAAEGHSILFISHKLYEVLEIADRITVIRRGKVVGERIPSETNEADLAELMVGRAVELTVDRGESHPAGPVAQRSPACEVSDDQRQSRPSASVDLEVRAGEILGIAGVAGNGQDELVEAIIGLRKVDRRPDRAGRARTSPSNAPREMNEAGVAYVPADRHRFGLVLPFSLADNMVLTSYYRTPFAHGILRDFGAIEKAAAEGIAKYDVRTPSPDVLGGHAVGREPAEAGRRARVRPGAEAAHPRPADARPRRRQHRVHPPPGDPDARRGNGDPARVGRARRGPRDVRPDRGHVPRPDRRDRRRSDGGQERRRSADGDRHDDPRAGRGDGRRRGRHA